MALSSYNHADRLPAALTSTKQKKTPSPAGAPGSKKVFACRGPKDWSYPYEQRLCHASRLCPSAFTGENRALTHFEPDCWFKMGHVTGLKLDLDPAIDIATIDADGREDIIGQVAEVIDVT
jgi:hypothetical protein